jgi:hypothetical protein
MSRGAITVWTPKLLEFKSKTEDIQTFKKKFQTMGFEKFPVIVRNKFTVHLSENTGEYSIVVTHEELRRNEELSKMLF